MNENPYPLVSIVTINYNKTNVTWDLLNSLTKVTYPNIEVIVVDNGSVDQSFKNLIDDFPDIVLLQSLKNHGFSGGNNIGIQACSGQYILLINNDVEVMPDFIEPLINVFYQYPQAGMVSPKIVYSGTGDRIQYAGSEGINPWTGRGKKNGYMEIDDGSFDHVRETQLVHGACLMVSRELVEKVGMLPEDYFIYYEEHDWAEHAKRQGYKLYYAGTSKIYHKSSVTAGNNTPLKTYYMARNRLMYLRRNVAYPAFFTSLFIFIFLAIPKNILLYAFRSDYGNLKAFVNGVLWHIGIRPVKLKQI